MDGVLVDNTAVQARAFQLLFRDLGLTTNARQLLKRLNGMPAGEILQTVFRHPVPEKQLKEYAGQREFLYRRHKFANRNPLLFGLRDDPRLDAFRTDPRYAELIRRTGLEP